MSGSRYTRPSSQGLAAPAKHFPVEAPESPEKEIFLLTEMIDNGILHGMQTTLRIDDEVYRSAKAEAAARGETLTRFIEEALRERIAGSAAGGMTEEMRERDRLMEGMLQRTARFRIGPKPSREEMNER